MHSKTNEKKIMKAIGFKNFRNFEELPMMDINGVTILVGPNNSGKSTITKACRLIVPQMYRCIKYKGAYGYDNEQMAELDFSEVCKTFKRAYRYGAELPMEFSVKSGYFTTTYKLKEGEVNSIDTLREIMEIAVYNEVDDFTWRCCFDEKVVKIEYTGKLLSNIIREDVRQRLRNDAKIGMVYRGVEEFGWSLEKAIDKTRRKRDVQKRDAIFDLNLASFELTEDMYDQIVKDIVGGDLELAEMLEKDTEVRIESLPINDLWSYTLGPNIPFPLYEGKNFSIFRSIEAGDWAMFTKTQSGNLKAYSKKKGLKLSVMDQESMMEHFSLSGKEDWIVDHGKEYDCNAFFTQIQKDYEQSLPSVLYIPVVDTPMHSVFYLQDQTDEASTLIKELYHSSHKVERLGWINNRLVELGIGKELVLNDSEGEGEIVKVYVVDNNDNKIPISDLGRGSEKLVLLLIKIILDVNNSEFNAHYTTWDDALSRYGYGKFDENYRFPDAEIRSKALLPERRTVVIEEPEQNLHPAMQSKLADLFLKIKSLGYNVIVETHSEYLVRRTQVIVASKNYADVEELKLKCPFTTFYISQDALPYSLEYRPDGLFEKDFGKGFYDVSSDLTMSLF